jgi:hypothetical protein
MIYIQNSALTWFIYIYIYIYILFSRIQDYFIKSNYSRFYVIQDKYFRLLSSFKLY